MKKFLIMFLALLAIPAAVNAGVIITGVLDMCAPNSSGLWLNCDVIELYVVGTVNFAGSKLWRSDDGAAFASKASISGTFTDCFVYMMIDARKAAFDNVFGTAGDYGNRMYYSSVITTGNDGFQIRDSGDNVLDQVWKPDATNVYTLGYLYRKDNTGPDGSWVETNWTFGGNNCIMDKTAAQIRALVPLGTYQIPEPATMALLGLGGLLLVRRKK